MSKPYMHWESLTLMLSPFAITRRFVVYPRQELKFVQRHSLCLNPELLVQFPLRRPSDALHSCLKLVSRLSGDPQRMRAACIGPHIRECDLLRRPLLKQQSVLRVEEEDGKCSVE